MAEDKVTLTADASQYFDVMRRAGDEAEKFGGKVGKTGESLEGLRLKSEARVANNIGRLSQSMIQGASAGDLLSQAIIRVTESFRGSLLFAGAATAGAALYEGLVKTGDAAIKLQGDIDDIRRGSRAGADFIGTDAINKNLDDTLSKMDEIRKRNIFESSTLAGRIVGTIRHYEGALANITNQPFAIPAFREQRNIDKQQQEDLAKAASADLEKLGDKQERLNNAEVDRVKLGEQIRAQDLEDIRHNEALGDIKEKATKAGIEATTKAEAEENRKYQINSARIAEEGTSLNRELESERNIAEIKKEVLPVADEQLQILKERISYLQNELNLNKQLSPEQRQQYNNEQQTLQAAQNRLTVTRGLEQTLARINFQASTGAISPAQAKIAGAQAQAAVAGISPGSPEDVEAQTRLREAQYGEYRAYRANPAEYIRQQQQEQIGRQNFQKLKKDYQERVRRGAYGQRGLESEIFGATSSSEASQLGVFPTSKSDFEDQFKRRGLGSMLREGAGGREDSFDRFFHPERVKATEQKHDGGNDIASNVKKIVDLLKNIAVK